MFLDNIYNSKNNIISIHDVCANQKPAQWSSDNSPRAANEEEEK